MAGPFSGVRRRSGVYSFLARCYPILGACVWRVAGAADAACHAAAWRASRLRRVPVVRVACGPSRRDGRRGLSGRCGLRREQLAAGAGDGVADVLAPQLAEGVECGAQPLRVLGWRDGEGMSRLGGEVGLEE